MFKIGQTVICVDSTGSHRVAELQYMVQYTVEDYSDCFVKLEGVKGEWHETRFVAVDEVVCKSTEQ